MAGAAMAYDVAIVGAGPAGSIAALVLARRGLRVALVVDAVRGGGNPRRGETLAPAAAAAVSRLGLSDEMARLHMPCVSGFRSRWGSARVATRPALLVPDAKSMAVDRGLFDATIRDAAIAAGAVMLTAFVRGVRPGRRGWDVSLGQKGNIAAHFVIDAAGRGARFARRVGARLAVVDELVAITAVLAPDEGDADRTVEIESHPNGWLFSTLDADGSRIVSFFTDRDLFPGHMLKHPGALLDRILARSQFVPLRAASQRRSSMRLWPAATLFLDNAVCSGLMAIGDAAQTRDPLSSQGIAAAIEDAESAATALLSAVDGDSVAIEQHEQQRQQKIVGYLRERQKHYAAERRWANSPFWQRRQSIALLTTKPLQRGPAPRTRSRPLAEDTEALPHG